MKLLITGVSGLLGLNAALQLRDTWEVVGCYHAHAVEAAGVRAFPCELGDAVEIARALDRERPQAIIHAAGLTSVDACESKPVLAAALNVSAAAAVAQGAARVGARLVHVSTDHVFDGSKSLWSERDRVCPLNVYAHTKADAERAVAAACPDALIVRTNFYGWGTARRESFSDWILRGLDAGSVRMFDDVFFTPLLVNDLVERMMALLERGASGIVHVGGSERLSKYDFGVRLARAFGRDPSVIAPVSVNSMALAARRPYDMSLESGHASALLGEPPRPLDQGLQALRRLGESGWRRDLLRASAVHA